MTTNECNVVFQYEFEDTCKHFDYPFNVLHASSVNEFSHIIMKSLQLPVYLENDIVEKLNNFVDKSAAAFYDGNLNKLIEETKSTSHDIEDTIKLWERTYKDETLEYSEKKCASDEELFAMAYHKLVHSPVLDTMLKLEHNYANTVRERIKKRDKQEQSLKDRQTEEMNTAIDNLNITTNEKSINHLVARHFEDFSLLQGKWSSELDTMKEVQRREYRDWIMQMLEENQTSNSVSTPTNSPLNSALTTIFPDSRATNQEYPEMPKYEESFTIHLGSQLKQMHNIRIMSSNVMDFCYVNSTNESLEPTPHLLQTSLALYSNDLCGLVLLTDNHVDSYSKMLKDFTQVCQYSTEFHFLHFDDQLEKVRESAKLNISVMSPQRKSVDSNSGNPYKASKNLQTGDVFVTRHSNLAQVHVIFHIVSDDTLLSKEINSRHPVLLGLRNILKTACSNDITSITIPLLLQYDMTEEMTVTWCTKRAELVFKCVKGFMIEMASWGGSELKNLQFVLPQGISNEVFLSLTGMLPNIFKVSNPLVLKTSGIQKR